MADYPFEGCCDHGSNSHTRERCLACDCTKPAVQVTSRPVVDGVDPGELADVRVCGHCRALTLADDRDAHAGWHEAELDRRQTLLDTLEKTLSALAALRQRVPTQKENP